MGTRGESGVLGGWEKPNIKQIVKKKSVKKSEKEAKLEKNRIYFFLLEMV